MNEAELRCGLFRRACSEVKTLLRGSHLWVQLCAYKKLDRTVDRADQMFSSSDAPIGVVGRTCVIALSDQLTREEGNR